MADHQRLRPCPRRPETSCRRCLETSVADVLSQDTAGAQSAEVGEALFGVVDWIGRGGLVTNSLGKRQALARAVEILVRRQRRLAIGADGGSDLRHQVVE